MPVVDFPGNKQQTSPSDPYSLRSAPLDYAALKAAVFEGDGGHGVVDQHLKAFDSLNGDEATAAREVELRTDEIAQLTTDSTRQRRRRARTNGDRSIVTRDAIVKRPLLHAVLSVFYMGTSFGLLGLSNWVGAAFVVRSGSDVFAIDPLGAHLFYALPAMAAIMFKVFESMLPDDRARDVYRYTFFGIGASAFIVWALMSAMAFAPETSQTDWRGLAHPDWLTAHSGTILLLSHIMVDCAGGYLIFSGGVDLWISNRKVHVEETALHGWLKGAEAEILTRKELAKGKLAAAQDYIKRRADARASLEREVRLAYRRLAQQHVALLQIKSGEATASFLSA